MSTEEPPTRVSVTEEFNDFLTRLDAQIAAEDREDARVEVARVKAGLPEDPRDLRAGPGWADGGTTPSR